MKRATHSRLSRFEHALVAVGALACLLFSDGVGPRLVPYPESRAWRPRAAHAGPARQAGTDHNPGRERALIALGVKLSSLKQDRAGRPSDTAGPSFSAAPPAPAPRLAARPATGHGPPATLLHLFTSNPRRGPPPAAG